MFTINHKHHNEKVPTQNVIYLWCIITSMELCDLPYMLKRLFGTKAVNSTTDSPITGRHLFTQLTHSYEISSPYFVRNLTRFKDSVLITQFLGQIRVVVNLGGGYPIPPEGEEVLLDQPEEEP